ncbi:Ulp1 protease family, C-terminal catalytic domain [Sesbania bispinosa]|nr:Ulp1 protease family, C-terminal catalytic domain [Sesbania bispinosa]
MELRSASKLNKEGKSAATERIMKKLCEVQNETVVLNDEPVPNFFRELASKISGKKLFSPVNNAKIRNKVLLTIASPSGFYISPRNEEDIPRTLIGSSIPKECFMSRADMLSKIFVPINDNNNHWFLLVIDILEKELIYLDSYPDETRFEERIRSVKKVAMYTEDLLQHPSFYQIELTRKPLVSEFEIIIPNTEVIQGGDSNDCGVWIVMWMSQQGNGYRLKARINRNTPEDCTGPDHDAE